MVNAVTKQVEESLVKEATALGAKRFHAYGVHLHLSRLKAENKQNDALTLLNIVNNGIGDTEGSLFLCFDYDLFVIVKTQDNAVVKKIISNLMIFYADDPLAHETGQGDQGKFYTLYDVISEYEQFFLACNKKLVDRREAGEMKKKALPEKDGLMTEQKAAALISMWKNAVQSRTKRSQPSMLIVEDQAFARQLLKETLSKEYLTMDAKNAEEGIQLYFSNAPNITFLDIELPDYDGFAVLKEIVKYDPEAFVVMTTANNNAAEVKKAISSGAKGYIVKPFTKQKLQQYIQHYKTSNLK